MLIPYFSQTNVNLNHLKFRFVYMDKNNLHTELADSDRFSSPAVQFQVPQGTQSSANGTSDPIRFILGEIYTVGGGMSIFDNYFILCFCLDDLGWLDFWWYSKFWFQFSMVKPVDRHVNLPYFSWWNPSWYARAVPTHLTGTSSCKGQGYWHPTHCCGSCNFVKLLHSKYWP